MTHVLVVAVVGELEPQAKNRKKKPGDVGERPRSPAGVADEHIGDEQGEACRDDCVLLHQGVHAHSVQAVALLLSRYARIPSAPFAICACVESEKEMRVAR